MYLNIFQNVEVMLKRKYTTRQSVTLYKTTQHLFVENRNVHFIHWKKRQPWFL